MARAACLAIVALLALVAAAGSRAGEGLHATAKVVKEGGRAELTITNTGTVPIVYLVFDPAGYDVLKVGWDGCSVSGGNVVCDRFPKYNYMLLPGQMVQVTITKTKPAGATGGGALYVNDHVGDDGRAGPIAVTGEGAEADLAVTVDAYTKQGEKFVRHALFDGKKGRSEEIYAQIDVYNHGKGPSTAADLTVALSSRAVKGVAFEGKAPEKCSLHGENAVCTVHPLVPGSGISFVFTFRTHSVGKVRVAAVVERGSPGDPLPNNQDDATLFVV